MVSRTRPRSTVWAGWGRFGAMVMLLAGTTGLFGGLVATFSPATVVRWGDYGLSTVDVSTWGWVRVAVSLLVITVGLALLGTRAAWARAAGVVLVGLTVVLEFAALPATPWWSLVGIVLCLLVLWSLVVHGDEVAIA